MNTCFRSMCDKNYMETYYASEDKEVNELYTKDIQQLNKELSFLKLFKECVKSEGMDCGEFFLSTTDKTLLIASLRICDGIISFINFLRWDQLFIFYESDVQARGWLETFPRSPLYIFFYILYSY